MKKITTMLVALFAITFAASAQGIPSKAWTLSGSGSIGKNNSHLAVTAGTFKKVSGGLHVQPRASLFFAEDKRSLNLGLAPTVALKNWSSATLYVATEVSAAFVKGADTYVQFAPELGVLCNIGKNAFSVTRFSYQLKDNDDKSVWMSLGVGFRL